ncbi:hypothetical protein, partial [Leptospira kmetyi]|uniref:hypothetical protein n=1 Tax=Leptospira kmetyi TaxID=408139 RepID=UPI0014383C28
LQSPSLGSEAKEKVRKNVRIIQKKYTPVFEKKDWLKQRLSVQKYKPLTITQRKVKENYLNDEFANNYKDKLQKKRFSKLLKELRINDEFWKSKSTKYFKKKYERKYNNYAFLIWNSMRQGSWLDLNSLLKTINIPRIAAYRVVRKWQRVGIISMTDNPSTNVWEKARKVRIKKSIQDLPNLLYSKEIKIIE